MRYHQSPNFALTLLVKYLSRQVQEKDAKISYLRTSLEEKDAALRAKDVVCGSGADDTRATETLLLGEESALQASPAKTSPTDPGCYFKSLCCPSEGFYCESESAFQFSEDQEGKWKDNGRAFKDKKTCLDRADKRHKSCGATLPTTSIFVDSNRKQFAHQAGTKDCLVGPWKAWSWCKASGSKSVQVTPCTFKVPTTHLISCGRIGSDWWHP